MNDIYLFNKTVRGYSHITRNIPCEDYSGSFSSDFYYIFSVADGHGDSTCFRSSKGSEFAIQAIVECFKRFANEYENRESEFNELFEDESGKRDIIVKGLIDNIVDSWNEKVQDDLMKNMVTEDEIKKYCEVNSRTYNLYMSNQRLNHIYGTTIIAGIKIYNHYILIQQGDGRCDVFFEDGTVSQSIPWDGRCEANVTTSLCDEDVKESFRFCIIDGNKTPITACIMGTDGVEDSYSDMEGTHCFYRKILLELLSNQKEYENYLEETLSNLSQFYSSDDISVAGIVNLSILEKIEDDFKNNVLKYDLNNEKQQIENLINSKTRKHDYLKKKKDEFDDEYNKLLDMIKDLELDVEVLEEKRESINKEQNRYSKKLKSTSLKKKINIFRHLKEKYISKGKSIKIRKVEKNFRLTNKEYDEICSDVAYKKKELTQFNDKKIELDKQKENVYAEFEEYDNQYQDLKNRYDEINKELENI